MATDTDYLIIGAGPAGLQLGYFLDRAGRDYRIIEDGPTPGTFFRTFPRHRRLISINKRFTGNTDPELNLRMDWNSLLDDAAPLFTTYTRRVLSRRRRHGPLPRRLRHATACGSATTPGHPVERTDDGFTVTDQHGEPHAARRLIVATGPSKPYIPADSGHRARRGVRVRVRGPRELHRPARADHRQGQLGVRDRGQPRRDRGRHPPRRPARDPDGLADRTSSATCVR